MTWRVLTWNILGAKSPEIDVVAAHLRISKPDVVALQEARQAQAKALAAALGWRMVWRRKHFPLTPLVWWRAEGLALLAPTALDDPRRYVLSRGFSTWTYRHRIMLAATVVRGGKRLRVCNVHLSSSHADERIEQARLAATFIRSEPSALRVVCGDMNAANELEVIREFHAVGVRDTGGDFTSHSRAPSQRLDYVLVPEDAKVSAIDTPEGGDEWAALSDHLPVLVEFTVGGFVPQ
ncbi:MAG: endonuclease/exonuclease/phosphatase family protein [Actinomycetia bacterium]|nr:endonuclease/exonuclease/phosphatase family protein [Actinomycetes bacterium]